MLLRLSVSALAFGYVTLQSHFGCTPVTLPVHFGSTTVTLQSRFGYTSVTLQL